MDALISDLQYAFRVFFKRPGLTILAIVALSVSLGMSTTAFSTLNGMFFKPLPFKDPEELQTVNLRNTKAEMKAMPIPYEQFGNLGNLTSFESVMGYFSGTINISGKGVPRRYDGAFVSPNFLDVLGESTAMGKSFTALDSQTDQSQELLISHTMWQEKFHGDPDIIGMPIRANGHEHVIVGVLKEGFHFPVSAQVWMPLDNDLVHGDKPQLSHIYAVGRLADGVTSETAQAELRTLFKEWKSDAVEEQEDLELGCSHFGRLQMNKASESLLLVAIGAVIFVLLVSCANVANLLVGRALTRGREMAIRSAVGATRSRIIRQLLTESLLLSLFGAIGGLLYAAWAVDASMQSSIYQLPYWMDFELDWRVFLFVLMIMLVTAMISGLVPAWQASKIDLNEMLKDTSHTSTSFRLGRLTRLLAVIQIAFSCALLFGAGLITRNVYQMSSIDPGYAKENILTMRMGLFPADYPDEADRDAFYQRLTSKVGKLPDVSSTAVTSWIGQFGNYKEPYLILKEDQENPDIAYTYAESVSPDYFKVFDLELLQGRLITGEDTEEADHVAVVNEAFAKAFFNGDNPIGRTVSPFVEGANLSKEQTRGWRIVGMVESIRVSDFTKAKSEEPIIYLPSIQTASPFMSLAVRSETEDMDALTASIQELILGLDPNLPVYFTKTMAGYVNDQIYPYSILADFFLAIGLMALFLAAIGVYGMLAFNVSRRRREIGIRMALGANTARIVAQVLRQGFVQVIIGIGVGTGLAYLVGKLTSNILFGINPTDPSVYVGVLMTLVGVATLAFFLPARRAARLSPMEALRYE